MHVTTHIVEGSDDFRMQGVADVEYESTSRLVIIGEKHSARRHHIFSVMNLHGLLIGHERRLKFPVCWRRGVAINDRQKIHSLFRDIASPGEDVVARRLRRPRR